jgi:hypothetical protein
MSAHRLKNLLEKIHPGLYVFAGLAWGALFLCILWLHFK